MDELLENIYFSWLCAKVMNVENPTPSLTYWKLLRELHTTPFVWLLSGDDNRAADGEDLRLEFVRLAPEYTLKDFEHIACSMLEMFIAFARRLEFETGDSEEHWFWKFMKALHLSKFNDARYNDEKTKDILDVFIWRTYKADATCGGLFPLKYPKRDQRQVELWYQFCDYAMENHLFV